MRMPVGLQSVLSDSRPSDLACLVSQAHLSINPDNSEIFLYKLWRTKGFFNVKGS